ncbi:hypothetical protein [Alloactinosynnema sp. L-07]|uniref:zinc finger domain-containing protein n=1 Tax=Alloactinosynnema sp. L-07 TaxID=1653480 RepID=UPI00065F02FC|nr:hypothetical protein [Alloactinosynnema sp. L-07]CRK59047.1 hypothetical protein [Alloactinosynnema sp. L-07]
MSPHRGHLRTGGQRHGLFEFAPGGDLNAGEAIDNPMTYRCAHCGAAPQEPCTRVGSGTTKRGYHPDRGRRPTNQDGPPPAVQAALARLANDPPQETQ